MPAEITRRPRRLVLGATGEARRTCAALAALGDEVVHLEGPTDRELAAVLAGGIDSMAVLLHDDTAALRYCLAAEHLSPGIKMFVAVFDRTTSKQLVEVAPNCQVMSPGVIALPSLIAACASDDKAAVLKTGKGTWAAYTGAEGMPTSFELGASMRFQSLLGRAMGQLRPHDAGSRIFMGGLIGLMALLAADTIAGMVVLHESFVLAFHAAVRTVATAGPVPVYEEHPRYLLFASLAMLLTIALSAMFTAGIVEHLLSGRLVGLAGRRVLPQRGHVIVVGMGQVGMRLAEELRSLGLAVVGVERDPRAKNLPMARAMGIPVHVGDASRKRVLQRVRVDTAVALCAVGSDELDNLAVSVAARAVSPTLRVVIRAGNHDAIAETQSLFRIGRACDVSGLTAAFVVQSLRASKPKAVLADGDATFAVLPESAERILIDVAEECSH